MLRVRASVYRACRVYRAMGFFKGCEVFLGLYRVCRV